MSNPRVQTTCRCWMSKIKYSALIALFLFTPLLLFRNSLVYQPILNHLEKRFEKKWDCELDKKNADLNLLKGSLTFIDTRMTTPINADSRWILDVNKIFIQIDYSSIFSPNLIINELVLDRLIFSYEQSGSSALKRERMPPAMITKQIEKGPGKEKVKRKGALIKHLLIRDGRFEFTFFAGPGKANKVKIEHVSLNKRDIFLGRGLYVFFRSLLEPLGCFSHRRP